MKTFGASSTWPATSRLCGPVKRAAPQTRLRFGVPLNQLVNPSADWATTLSLRAFTTFMSTLTGPLMFTPNSAACRATCAARALATSVLVGMQPSLTQVPPR